MWIDHALFDLFDVTERLSEPNADAAYGAISERLAHGRTTRPRALYDRFGIEAIATTDSALDDLRFHAMARDSDWFGRVIPTYRPDAVIDPAAPDFIANLDRLGEVSGRDTGDWRGYLEAHRARRKFFRSMGATATDHGHPTPLTADLPEAEASALYDRARGGKLAKGEAELFRAQMLTEMARMSCEDGLVMQLHPGSLRGHSTHVRETYGTDRGFDIPVPVNYTQALLSPLLNAVGLHPQLTLILFTLDETTYSRETRPAGRCLALSAPRPALVVP